MQPGVGRASSRAQVVGGSNARRQKWQGGANAIRCDRRRGEVDLESTVGHFAAAKTTAMAWPIMCYACGRDPPKSLDFDQLTAAAAQSYGGANGRTSQDHAAGRQAEPGLTGLDRPPSGLVSVQWSLVTADLGRPRPDEILRYSRCLSLSGLVVAHLVLLHDHSNTGAFQLPTTVTVTVTTLSHADDPSTHLIMEALLTPS